MLGIRNKQFNMVLNSKILIEAEFISMKIERAFHHTEISLGVPLWHLVVLFFDMDLI